MGLEQAPADDDQQGLTQSHSHTLSVVVEQKGSATTKRVVGVKALDSSSSPESDFVQDGSVDYKGRPARKSTTGGWRACFFFLGNDVTERVSYYGVSSNLVTYLTEVMGEGLATAAQNVNNWSGSVFLCSIPGAFLGDALWGRYRTIAVFGFVNLIGMVMLVCAVTVDSLRPACLAASSSASSSSCASYPPTRGRRAVFFYLSLYIMALGSGVMKPCIVSLGAAQFDEQDPVEAPRRASFFNWWFTMIAIGIVLSVTLVVYVQDFVGWGWGYGIPAMTFALALAVFLSGTRLYRYQPLHGHGHGQQGPGPFTQVAQVVVAAARKWRVPVPRDPSLLHELSPAEYAATPHRRRMPHTPSLRLLDKAAVVVAADRSSSSRSKSGGEATPSPRSTGWALCTVTQVEEVKLLARTLPVWVCAVVYLVTYTQMNTLFTKQGSTLDNRIGSGGFRVPPASMQVVAQGTVMLGLPLYDRLLVPCARRVTGNPRGISLLQRYAVGFAFSVVSMACAGLTERHRLAYLHYHPPAPPVAHGHRQQLPLTIFRLVPQYVTMGVSEVFAVVAGFDFFYDQTPDHMHTLGGALNLSALGAGSFLSTGFIQLTSRVNSALGRRPWVGADIDASRVDIFYWFLAAVGVLNLFVFTLIASRYTYKKAVPASDESGNADGQKDDQILESGHRTLL